MIASFPALRMRRGRSSAVDALDARREPAASLRFHLAAVRLRWPRLRGTDRVASWRQPMERRSARSQGAEAADLGIPCIALFPNTPNELRTDDAREALNSDNLICRAIKAIKDAVPEIGVLTDVALDPYTSHGHDGMID